MSTNRILSFRRGRKTQNVNQAVVSTSAKNREEAQKMIGTRMEIKFSKAVIKGVVTRAHGSKGKVVVRFRRGLPGQAINRELNLSK